MAKRKASVNIKPVPGCGLDAARRPSIGQGGQEVDLTGVALQEHLGDAGCRGEIAVDLKRRVGVEQVRQRRASAVAVPRPGARFHSSEAHGLQVCKPRPLTRRCIICLAPHSPHSRRLAKCDRLCTDGVYHSLSISFRFAGSRMPQRPSIAAQFGCGFAALGTMRVRSRPAT